MCSQFKTSKIIKACTGVRGEPSAVENCGRFGLPTARMFIIQPSSARHRLSMAKDLTYLTSVKCLRCKYLRYTHTHDKCSGDMRMICGVFKFDVTSGQTCELLRKPRLQSKTKSYLQKVLRPNMLLGHRRR